MVAVHNHPSDDPTPSAADVALTVEAEARDWHGLRWLWLRCLENGNIQGLIIATGQSLKRFLAGTGAMRPAAASRPFHRTGSNHEPPPGWVPV